MKDVVDDAVEGVVAVRSAVATVKLFLAGLVITGIGVSQAMFGWVGDGFVYRVLYPIPLVLFGVAILWVTCMPVPKPDAGSAEESSPDDA